MKQQEKKGVPNEIIKERWQKFAPIYELSDSSNQTFFYSLVNMLQMQTATHILQVGCGAGKLIPYLASLKPQNCIYFASDISETMIQLARKFLTSHNQRIGITQDLNQWLKSQNIDLRAVNGEKTIDVPYKFDRIICNLVLQIAQDPRNMLKNLYDLAAPGCLLGVTVWGNPQLMNFLTLKDKALVHLGRPLPDARSNFHLYNRLGEVAADSGWELVIQWDQNAPYPYFEMTENLKALNDYSSMMDKEIIEYTEGIINQIFKDKKILNFQAQLAILRKK